MGVRDSNGRAQDRNTGRRLE